jgi:hypothetical protein
LERTKKNSSNDLTFESKASELESLNGYDIAEMDIFGKKKKL